MLANPYLPAIFIPLILFALYRRFRRHFGRQTFQRGRTIARTVLLTIVMAFFIAISARDSSLLMGALVGAAIGAALAVVALRLTTFERTDAGIFYTPNPYIGALLSALLIGRLVYRFLFLAPVLQAAQRAPSADPFAGLGGSPLTSAIVMTLLGYYAVYAIGLVLRSKHVELSSPRVDSPPT